MADGNTTISQSWPGSGGRGLSVVDTEQLTDGWCPMGEAGCTGLVWNEGDNKFECGMGDHPDETRLAGRCRERISRLSGA